jgi:WD40 repeat protein
MAVALSDGYVKTALGETIDQEQVIACVHVLWGHQAPISCLAVSSDLDVVVSGSLDGAICVHSVRQGKFVRTIYPSNDANKEASTIAVRKIALDGHGTFVVHMEDQSLHAYTVNGVHLCSASAREHLHDMTICSNGEILITGGDRCRVVIRTVRDLKVQSILDISRHGPIRCLTLTPDDLNPIPQFLFIGSDDGTITIVDEDPLSNDERTEMISFFKTLNE